MLSIRQPEAITSKISCDLPAERDEALFAHTARLIRRLQRFMVVIMTGLELIALCHSSTVKSLRSLPLPPYRPPYCHRSRHEEVVSREHVKKTTSSKICKV
ncbi:hypothetical protein B9Z55_022892 [Caenorhabditis nigoni]|uniref:Uncharacterized protein n=1 Tax=Caenorhabditis nigoni TaxID=1611254 RepID=A0A2G5SMQ5_9PELO|nr:hypothetical protein B9Z55_022892 [Caenorhabditis nigoni]